ncbi:MAG TPA: hypothetical protein VMM92_12355 [Thermoanaerobaculia bacterium]|nr:hypothetical protein [Thermoanaerobaculia bacterium]
MATVYRGCRVRLLVLPTVLLALAVTSTACSVFQSSRRLDMRPFGENTVQMVGEMQKFQRPAPWVYLKKYSDDPKVLAVGSEHRALQALLRRVALYSLEVVALGESRLSEQAKVRELANYLQESVRPNIPDDTVNEVFGKGDLDEVISDVRTRKTFIDALAAAQPLVAAVQAAGLRIFDRFDERVSEAEKAVGAEIESEFAPLKRTIKELEDLQLRNMDSVTLIYQHRLGAPYALEELRRIYPPAAEQLPPGKEPTAWQLEAAELGLVDELDRIQRLKDQLIPEFNIYKESQRELEALRILNEERARLGRATLTFWARSHKSLGMGVVVPPVIDMVALLRTATGSAAGTAAKAVPGL